MAYVISQKAARALTRIIRGSADATAPTYRAATISPDFYPPPFTVRWSQSESGGQGAWVIWLPLNTGGNHVYIGRERRPIGNLNAVQTLPAGWYILDMLSANYSGSLWLNASKAKAAGQTESTFLATTGQGDGSGNMYWYAAIVARIDYDSETGARRVKQLIDSTVTFGANIGDGGGGGGGGVELDGISINGNLQNQVQVHNWNTGTPESGTTLAQDLHNADGVTAQGMLVERTTGGALDYKKIGTLAQLLGSTVSKSSQKILTGLTWNTTSHKLVISSANITIANGVITAWADNADTEIATTPISNIIPS